MLTPPLPYRLPIFPPTLHSPQKWGENYRVNLSAWIPNCNKSGSLVFLPLRTLASDFKSSPISQVDTCQLAPCISQNKTPLRYITPPTNTSCIYLRLFFRISLRSGPDLTVQMFTEVPSAVLQSPPTEISERTPDFRTKQVSQKSAPFCPFAEWHAEPAWALGTFTTEAKLSKTDGDSGGGGGKPQCHVPKLC